MANTISSYATLQQAIVDWLARSDLTDFNYLPEIIQMAQDRIYHGYTPAAGDFRPGLRLRQMEKALPGGNINKLTITAAGSGYTSPPTVTFSAAPAGGTTATGVAVLDNGNPITTGAVTSITLTNPGQLYTSAPTITFGSGAAAATCTISSTPTLSPSGNYAVPSDYLDMKYLYANLSSGNALLERKPAEWLISYYGVAGTGIPAYIARDGGVFITGPQADSAYAVGGVYFYQDTYLSDTYTSNWLTTNYPLLLLAASLAETGVFIKDADVVSYWEGRYATMAANLQAAYRREQQSGSPLVMTPG